MNVMTVLLANLVVLVHKDHIYREQFANLDVLKATTLLLGILYVNPVLNGALNVVVAPTAPNVQVHIFLMENVILHVLTHTILVRPLHVSLVLVLV